MNLAGGMVSAATTFALTIIVARGTAQSSAGAFFSATALFLLATNLGQLGTATGLVYFLSASRVRAVPHTASTLMRVAMRPVVATAVVMGLSIFLLSGPIAGLLSPGREALFSQYLRFLAPMIPFAAILNVSVSGTRGLGTMRANALVDQIARPFLQLLCVALALLWGSSVDIALGWTIPYVPLSFVAWLWWTRERNRVVGIAEKADTRPGKVFWRFTAPRALASVAQVAMQRLDIVLVGALAGLPQAAIYAATTRFLSLGQLAQGALSQSVQPHLGEALATNDHRQAADLYKTTTAWLVLGTWPIYLGLMIFAPVVLTVLGHSYSSGTGVLALLCAAWLVASGSGMVDMVLTMAGRTSWNLVNVLIAFTINLGLDLWLIPVHGVLGAAVGWMVAILAANVIPLIQVGLVYRLHPFGRATLTAMASCMLSFGAIPLTARLILGARVSTMVLALGFAVVALAACLWSQRSVLALPELVGSVKRRAKPSH